MTAVLVVTLAVILGKIVAGLPVGRGVDRLAVGMGMLPRGEIGVIFASISRGLGVVNDVVFSAFEVMTMASMLSTPPALKWSLGSDANQGS